MQNLFRKTCEPDNQWYSICDFWNLIGTDFYVILISTHRPVWTWVLSHKSCMCACDEVGDIVGYVSFEYVLDNSPSAVRDELLFHLDVFT